MLAGLIAAGLGGGGLARAEPAGAGAEAEAAGTAARAGPAAAEAAAAPRGLRSLVERVGRPKAPVYVRANEIIDFDRLRFRRPRDLQVAHPGRPGRPGRPLMLDPGKAYLWAVGADGRVAVAEYRQGRDGGENIGHPNLLGGGYARLAGELHFRGGHWEINNDSGRYSWHYPEVKRDNLRAAKALIERVGAVNLDGSAARMRMRFYEPERIDRASTRDKRIDIRKMGMARELGGYYLRPSKGGPGDTVPRALRDPVAKRAWMRRAAERLGPAGAAREREQARGPGRRGPGKGARIRGPAAGARIRGPAAGARIRGPVRRAGRADRRSADRRSADRRSSRDRRPGVEGAHPTPRRAEIYRRRT